MKARFTILAVALYAVAATAQHPLASPSARTYGLGYPFADHGYDWSYGPPPAHDPHWTGAGWRSWNRPTAPSGRLAPPAPPKSRYPAGSGLGGLMGRSGGLVR